MVSWCPCGARATPASSSRGSSRATRPRAAGGGPNKRERLKEMVSTNAGGHQWEVTSENRVNMLIQCRVCSLIVRQVHPPRHVCPPGDAPRVWVGSMLCLLRLGCTPLNNMTNLGKAWLCSRCHAHLWAAYTTVEAGTSKGPVVLTGRRRRGLRPLAPFLSQNQRASWLPSQTPNVLPKGKNRAKSAPPGPRAVQAAQARRVFQSCSPSPILAFFARRIWGSQLVTKQHQHSSQQTTWHWP